MKKTIILVPVIFSSVAAIGFACGPWLTTAFIAASTAILTAPSHLVGHDFQRLKAMPSVPPKLQAAATITETWKNKLPSTLDVDVSDMKQALHSRGVDEARAHVLLDGYETLRLGQLGRWQDAEKKHLSEKQLARYRQVPDTHEWINLQTWPEEIPTEFRLYAEGVEDLHRGNIAAARKHWQEVLDLPLDERRVRSTWAAWMLMKTTPQSRLPEALGKVVHASLDEGCADSLRTLPAALALLAGSATATPTLEDLAFHCFNTKANDRGRYLEALDEAARRIGTAEEKSVIMQAARDPYSRRLISTVLAGSSGKEKSQDKLTSWLAIVEEAGVSDDPVLADLAVAFYNEGSYDLSRRALAMSARTWASRWIAGKLALQRGAVKEATAYYADALKLMPHEERARIVSVTESESYRYTGYAAPNPESVRNSTFLAECGTVRLSKSDFEGALKLFIDAKCPHDAAFVAEHLMSCDELLGYIRKHALKIRLEITKPDADEVWHSWHDDRTCDPTNRLLYVIARKLSREKYFTRAREFYPPAILPYFDRYIALRKMSTAKNLKTSVRAAALMEAARFHRWCGMELFGAEGEPDAAVWDGAFPADPLPQTRVALNKRLDYGWNDNGSPQFLTEKKTDEPLPLLSSSDEIKRLKSNPLFGKPRFHYRYVAAQLARQAAHMLPDDSNEAAMMLAEGGTWLPPNDNGADPYFEELISRYKDTPFAREADQRRWYPDQFRRDVSMWNAEQALAREGVLLVPQK